MDREDNIRIGNMEYEAELEHERQKDCNHIYGVHMVDYDAYDFIIDTKDITEFDEDIFTYCPKCGKKLKE